MRIRKRKAITTKEVEKFKSISHLNNTQIALEMKINPERVKLLRQRYTQQYITPKGINFIKNNPHLTLKEIASVIGVSISSVWQYRQKQKLKL